MLKQFIDVLRANKLTVSFAESCTGGRLSAVLTEVSGVSDIFLGSVVSYSNQAKQDLLGVRRDTLLEEGAVSESTARQMAQGARNKLKSEYSVSITGIAGPTGGSPEKPVGTVCFAVAGTNFVESRKMKFSGSRTKIQAHACDYALQFLTEVLNKQFA